MCVYSRFEHRPWRDVGAMTSPKLRSPCWGPVSKSLEIIDKPRVDADSLSRFLDRSGVPEPFLQRHLHGFQEPLPKRRIRRMRRRQALEVSRLTARMDAMYLRPRHRPRAVPHCVRHTRSFRWIGKEERPPGRARVLESLRLARDTRVYREHLAGFAAPCLVTRGATVGTHADLRAPAKRSSSEAPSGRSPPGTQTSTTPRFSPSRPICTITSIEPSR